MLPYNDYFEYYGPDYRLHMPTSNMENMNKRETLEEVGSLSGFYFVHFRPHAATWSHISAEYPLPHHDRLLIGVPFSDQNPALRDTEELGGCPGGPDRDGC